MHVSYQVALAELVPHTKLQPPGKISVNSDNATGIFSPRASSIPLQLDAANYISSPRERGSPARRYRGCAGYEKFDGYAFRDFEARHLQPPGVLSLYNEVYDIIKFLCMNLDPSEGGGPPWGDIGSYQKRGGGG